MFERFRQQQDEPRTLQEFAETQLVSEIRFWSTKYISVSWLLGANITFFAYHMAFKHMKRYVGIPLTIATFFVSRNLIMKGCMDRIYWPLDGIYKRMRAEDKQRKEE